MPRKKREPSIRVKLLKDLRIRRKTLKKQLTKINRDIRSLSCPRQPRTTVSTRKRKFTTLFDISSETPLTRRKVIASRKR